MNNALRSRFYILPSTLKTHKFTDWCCEGYKMIKNCKITAGSLKSHASISVHPKLQIALGTGEGLPNATRSWHISFCFDYLFCPVHLLYCRTIPSRNKFPCFLLSLHAPHIVALMPLSLRAVGLLSWKYSNTVTVSQRYMTSWQVARWFWKGIFVYSPLSLQHPSQTVTFVLIWH